MLPYSVLLQQMTASSTTSVSSLRANIALEICCPYNFVAVPDDSWKQLIAAYRRREKAMRPLLNMLMYLVRQLSKENERKARAEMPVFDIAASVSHMIKAGLTNTSRYPCFHALSTCDTMASSKGTDAFGPFCFLSASLSTTRTAPSNARLQAQDFISGQIRSHCFERRSTWIRRTRATDLANSSSNGVG